MHAAFRDRCAPGAHESRVDTDPGTKSEPGMSDPGSLQWGLSSAACQEPGCKYRPSASTRDALLMAGVVIVPRGGLPRFDDDRRTVALLAPLLPAAGSTGGRGGRPEKWDRAWSGHDLLPGPRRIAWRPCWPTFRPTRPSTPCSAGGPSCGRRIESEPGRSVGTLGYRRNLCMKADQPAIAPCSVRRGGSVVISARFVSFCARRPAARGRSGGLARGPHRRAVGRPGSGRAAASRPSWRRRSVSLCVPTADHRVPGGRRCRR